MTQAHLQSPSGNWDASVNAMVNMVQPGDYAITGHPDQVIGTLLGSCVSACIYDPYTGIGGLNHFLLPDVDGAACGASDSASTRYGIFAMEMLINGIMKQGGSKARMKAKLFGGAHFAALSTNIEVGRYNKEFALDFLRREKIEVVASDLGGKSARRIFFNPGTNKVLVRIKDTGNIRQIQADEKRLRNSLESTGMAKEVELF